MAISELRFVDLAQAGCCYGVVGKYLKQLVGRGAQFLLNGCQGNFMGIGGQVVLQLGELFEPVAPHQIGSGG